MLLAGCAGSEASASGASDTPTSAAAVDANTAACAEVRALWENVNVWGTTPGNTDASGAPTADGYSDAPNYRLMLDEIRQRADGSIRTAMDEYFDAVPTAGAWWFANGAHEYGLAHGVADACQSTGKPINTF